VLRIGFDPVLPPWKTEALLTIPMSQGGKVVGQYTHGAEIVARIPHAVLCDGPVGFVWPRPVGPEDTVVLLGLIGDRHDGALRSEPAMLAALDEIVRTVVGDGPRRIAGVLRDRTAEEFTRGVVSLPFADTERKTALLAQRIGRVITAVSQLAYFAGIAGAGIAIATVIANGLGPVFAAIGQTIVFRDRPDRRTLLRRRTSCC